MKRTIKKSEIRKIVTECLNEAMEYDKERKQYFPKYTGNPHKDAGSYTHDYRDDFNYTRNDYQWHDRDRQNRFNTLQWERDMEIDPTNPDREGEADAENYLYDKDNYRLVDKAIEDLTPSFQSMIENFVEKAKQKHPVLKDSDSRSDFAYKLRELFDDIYYNL